MAEAVAERPVRARPSYADSFFRQALRRFRRHKLAVAGAWVILGLYLMAIFAPWLAPYDPLALDLAHIREKPSWEHPFGRDEVGRDLLARIIYGSRIALTVGFVTAGISLAVGVMCGAVAGYFGGTYDMLLMRLVDTLMAFPTLLLIIAVVAVVGANLWNVVIAIGLATWSGYARVVRATVLSLREQAFVEAARAVGVGDLRILLQHVLPNCLAPIVVLATLNVSTAILLEAALSFLGLGVRPPTPAWGSILGTGRQYITTAPHISAFPGIFITITVLAFNLVGDGLRDALDPRMKL